MRVTKWVLAMALVLVSCSVPTIGLSERARKTMKVVAFEDVREGPDHE